MDWDGDIAAGQVLDVPYLMHFSSPSEINGVILLGVQLCGNNGVAFQRNQRLLQSFLDS